MLAMNTPNTEVELLQNVQKLAGMSLGQLAQQQGVSLPERLLLNKGWIGQLLERALGTDAGTQALPDFTALNIELKTIPINPEGKPLESTFVCMVSLLRLGEQTWQTSAVRRKLARVLWVPVITRPGLPLAQRQLGQAVLWSPSEAEEALLQQDWQELTELLLFGHYDQISAKLGEVLQIRPKAQDSSALCWGVSEEGERVLTLPRGFYLRAAFTAKILQIAYPPREMSPR
jgi:DNA mismatch repair protein MutH